MRLKDSFEGRKPHNFKKIINKAFNYSLNDRWQEFFSYFFVEFVNRFPEWFLKLFNEKKICPICKFETYSFIHLSNHREISWNSACQRCDSRSRHRGLFFLYKKYISNQSNRKILHFAPEIILSTLFKKNNNLYFTTDLHMKNVDYPKEDIQNLSFEDSTFDVVLCNHVLEHVKNDIKALEEISRVLKTNGIAIITIPGNWKSKQTIPQNPFINNGHYRHYGLDIESFMKKKFNVVRRVNMNTPQVKLHAIKKLEVAYICEK